MTTELTKAAQQALEALDEIHSGKRHPQLALAVAHNLRRALTQRPAAQTEREAFEAAMKDSWQMVDPFRAPTAGSYYAGEHVGICAALKTVRANFDRHWQARASLPTTQQATPEPVPAEQAKWCEYVAGMVDCWINSHWPNYNHMDEDRRVKAIAGIIERRLWALQKQAAATPEPVGESAGRIELDCRQWLEDQRIDGGPHGFEAVGVEALSRMWRAARASNQTELVGEVSAESILNQWMAECGVYMVEKMGHQWASQTKQADLLYLVEKAITCTRPAPGVPEVDDLAQFIRQIDGKHSMGAGALAEHICDWLAAAQAKGGRA